MRRAAARLAPWGRLHRLNDYLDENVLTKQTKPPVHAPKLDFTDWSRTQEFARQGKERFEPEQAPVEPFLRDPSGRNLSHTEGLDSTVHLERFNPSKIARGLVMNRWLTPFQFRVIQYKTFMRLTPRGKAGRITCLVMVGNGKGVAGLGWGRHNNFRAKGPVLTNAIQQAFRNLVAINPDPPYLLHTIRAQWREQKMVLRPCHRVVGPYYARQAAQMFGLKGVRIDVVKRPGKYVKPNPLLRTFFFAMERYHRGVEEIAASRGLVPQGNLHGVKSYVEEIRAYKGMYTQSPPVSNRDTAADRWKWATHRHQVLQYPNPQLLQEILYGDLQLGAAAAAAQGATIHAVEALPPGPAQAAVEAVNSGVAVGDPWQAEGKEQKVRQQVKQLVATLQASRAKLRRSWVANVLKKQPELTAPDINDSVQEALRSAIQSKVLAGP